MNMKRNPTKYETCLECHTVLVPKVLIGNKGFHIGTWCDCGPCKRLSDYYKNHENAEIALKTGNYSRFIA